MIRLHRHSESHVFVECDLDRAISISRQFEFYAPNYMFSPKYKSGIWDGKIRLFSTKTCLLPQGLLGRLTKYLDSVGEDHEVVDSDLLEHGPRIASGKVADFAIKIVKCKYVPYDHQVSAVQQFLYRRKMVGLSATSSGKSYAAFLFFNLLKYLNDEFKFLLVVPTVNLVNQMAEDFKEYGENFCDFDEHVHRITAGCQKYTDKSITVSTWQSLQKMPKKYFQQFDALVIDECHQATAKNIVGIVEKCENARFKIGMTGTLDGCKMDRLQLEALFGRISTISRTADLMKKGLVSKLKINAVVLDYPQARRKAAKNLEYAGEVKLINSLSEKRRYVAGLAASRKKNTLVLFRLQAFGKAVRDELEGSSGRKVFYVDGTVKDKYRTEVRRYCEANDDAIVVASYGTFSTGISIRNLHNVVFAESMKAYNKVLQSVGRLLRLHESKDCAVLFDLGDDLSRGKSKKSRNYVLGHFMDRIGYYEAEGFDYRVKTVRIGR
jgi:superfamily II DNA or RNA helicase